MLNKKIGSFILTEEIGKGGMSKIYKAVHENIANKVVAIKILNPTLSVDANIKERFKNEANIMAGLNHQNITLVNDFIEQDGVLAIILELLEGESLSKYIRKKGALSKQDGERIFSQILNAFSYAHKKGVIHRDVKPSNIFIEKNGNVKILDFGIAKIISDDGNLTNTGTQMGTPVYMSPEQVQDSKNLDSRSDIYSLGVVLFYIFNGKPPYDTSTNSNFTIFNKIVEEPLPKIKNKRNLNQIIVKATLKDPSTRYQTCDDFLHSIQNIDEDNDYIKNNDSNKLENKSNTDSDQNKTLVMPVNNKDNNNTVPTKPEKRKLKKKYLVPGVSILMLIAFVCLFLIIKKCGGNNNNSNNIDTTNVILDKIDIKEQILTLQDGNKAVVRVEKGKYFNNEFVLVFYVDWYDKDNNKLQNKDYRIFIAREQITISQPDKFSYKTFDNGKLDYIYFNHDISIVFKYIGTEPLENNIILKIELLYADTKADAKDSNKRKSPTNYTPSTFEITYSPDKPNNLTKYDKQYQYLDGLSAINDTSNAKWGFINLDREIKIPLTSDWKSITGFSHGLAGVKGQTDKWGFINKKGELIIDYKYSNVKAFEYEKANVTLDGKEWFYIDRVGNKIE